MLYGLEVLMEQGIIEVLFNKETVFFALFLWLLWEQQKEKKSQNQFILEQQGILSNLTGSFEKLADNQEKLTGRIERIEVNVEKLQEKDDEK